MADVGKRRFAPHIHEEIIAKRATVIPENTKKSNKHAAKIFRTYLGEKRTAKSLRRVWSRKTSWLKSWVIFYPVKVDSTLSTYVPNETSSSSMQPKNSLAYWSAKTRLSKVISNTTKNESNYKSAVEVPKFQFLGSEIGKHALATKMSDMSARGTLSETYTNRSIRATEITFLTQSNFK